MLYKCNKLLLFSPSAFFRAFAVYSRQIDASALCYQALETKPMVQNQKYKSVASSAMFFAAFSCAVVTKQRGKTAAGLVMQTNHGSDPKNNMNNFEI